MVKIRRSRQPRDWQDKTGFRSASGFVASLADHNTSRMRKGKVGRHTEKYEYIKNGEKIVQTKRIKGQGTTFDVTELNNAQQIAMLRHSLKKQYRRLNRFRQLISLHPNDQIGADAYGKEQICLDIINERLHRIAKLEEKQMSYDKGQNTIKANEKKATQELKSKMSLLEKELERKGRFEELEKKRAFDKANAKLQGNLSLDHNEVGKTHKPFSEQPRKKRGTNDFVVIVKKDKNTGKDRRVNLKSNTTTVNRNINGEEKTVFRKGK